MKKYTFTSKSFDKYFNYATSIRESTLEFCDKEISHKEWIHVAYEKQTKNLIKDMIKNLGVKKREQK